MTTITITSWGETFEVSPQFDRYMTPDGPLCISFICDEGPFGKLTVNMPNDPLPEGEVWIKDWAENQPLVLALLDAGWIEYTGREAQAGFAIAKAARPAGDLLKEITRLGM